MRTHRGGKTKDHCVATIVAFFALLPGAAQAVNLFSMRDLPVRYMTDEDKDILKAAVFGALDQTPDGSTQHWQNSKTGAHGDLTPRASFDRSGQPCRDLEVANSARGHNNRVVLTFCKLPDGEWRVESQ